jgi:hypothetical protein
VGDLDNLRQSFVVTAGHQALFFLFQFDSGGADFF